MRCCVSLPNAGACGDPRTLAELAAVAEDAGWDAVMLEDYIVYQSRQDVPTYDPWVALAAVATRTERIRLGTLVTPLARRGGRQLVAGMDPARRFRNHASRRCPRAASD